MSTSTPTPGYATLIVGGRLSLLFWLSLLARLSFAMTSLSLFLLFASEYGSPASGGAAIAGFGIANVVATPIRGRFLDCYGTRFVLPALGSAYGVMLAATIATTRSDCPIAVPLVCTVIAGLFLAPMGAVMRVRWAMKYPGTAAKARAYSVDAAAEEAIYAIGPAVVGLLVGFVSPVATMVATVTLGVLGTVGFALLNAGCIAPQRESSGDEMKPHTTTSLLRQPGFLSLVVILIMVGGGLGIFEVAAPVFSSDKGNSASAGFLLTVFAVASAVGGIVYGARTWSTPLALRLTLIAAAYFTILCAFTQVESLLWFAVASAVSGLLFAPAMITGYMLVDTIGSPQRATERTSWINAAMNFGAAIGSGVGGAVLVNQSVGLVLASSGIIGLVIIGLVSATNIWRVAERPAIPRRRLSPATGEISPSKRG